MIINGMVRSSPGDDYQRDGEKQSRGSYNKSIFGTTPRDNDSVNGGI